MGMEWLELMFILIARSGPDLGAPTLARKDTEIFKFKKKFIGVRNKE